MLNSLILSAQQVVAGTLFMLTVGLNGPASSTVDITVEMRHQDSAQTEEIMLSIGRREQSGSLSHTLNDAGEYQVWVTGATFQYAVTTLLPPLHLDLERRVLAEGEETTLTVSIPGSLMEGQTLDVLLSLDRVEGIEFPGANAVQLTRETRSQTVRVRAIDDAIAEPRQTVTITARVQNIAGAAEVERELEIARNDYAMVGLAVQPYAALASDEPAAVAELPVTVVLNARASAVGEGIVRAVPVSGAGTAVEENFTILPGQEAFPVSLMLDAQGVYTVSATRVRFTDMPVDADDQLGIGVWAPAMTVEVLPPLNLELALDPGIIAEGEMSTLIVSVTGTLPEVFGERVLVVELEWFPVEQVFLPVVTIPLDNDRRSVAVQLGAVDDSDAEMLEEVSIHAWARYVAGVENDIALQIEHNDYALSRFEVSPRVLNIDPVSGRATVTITVGLNAVPSSAAGVPEFSWEVRREGVVPDTDSIRFAAVPAGSDRFSFDFALPEAGTYTLSLVRGSGRFTMQSAGGQATIPVPLTEQQLRVLPPVGLRAILEAPAAVSEGGVAVNLVVEAENLVPGTTLSVTLSADPPDEVVFTGGAVLELAESGSRARVTVPVVAVDDSEVELRESVEIRAVVSAGPQNVPAATATLAIGRSDYAVESLEAEPSRLLLGTATSATAEITVRLNAPAPAAVQLSLAVTKAGESVAFSTQTGVIEGSEIETTVTFENFEDATTYTVTITQAAFTAMEPQDQTDLLLPAPSLVLLAALDTAPVLNLDIDGEDMVTDIDLLGIYVVFFLSGNFPFFGVPLEDNQVLRAAITFNISVPIADGNEQLYYDNIVEVLCALPRGSIANQFARPPDAECQRLGVARGSAGAEALLDINGEGMVTDTDLLGIYVVFFLSSNLFPFFGVPLEDNRVLRAAITFNFSVPIADGNEQLYYDNIVEVLCSVPRGSIDNEFARPPDEECDRVGITRPAAP